MHSVTILFTNRDKVTERKVFVDGQIQWINGLPPKFITWNGKLWQHKGMGMTAYFYREVESFVAVG